MTTYENRLQEFKALKSKVQPNKGYMQGLSIDEYSRINSLHAFLVSTLEGKTSSEKINFLNEI
tara:strand:+ start:271 stop:459 length:189 start_codon:yes stop_codon:yes gene_type:complete